jgi:hypothetical protein
MIGLATLGLGVVLAYVTLPLLRAVSRERGASTDSRVRSLSLVLVLSASMLGVPFVRDAIRSTAAESIGVDDSASKVIAWPRRSTRRPWTWSSGVSSTSRRASESPACRSRTPRSRISISATDGS